MKKIKGSIVGLIAILLILLIREIISFLLAKPVQQTSFVMISSFVAFFIGGAVAAIIDKGRVKTKVHVLIISLLPIITIIYYLFVNYQEIKRPDFSGDASLLSYVLVFYILPYALISIISVLLGSKITSKLINKSGSEKLAG